MAFELAPWLQPQNFMQAINQGSQFGLNVVQTNQKAWEMDQQRQQAMATLQQNWAEKVMQNQRMTEQNKLTTESNQLYRTGMLDARNRGLDIQDARLNQPPKPTAAPPGFSLTPGQTRYDAMGNPLASLPPNPAKVPVERQVSPLSTVQQTEYTDLLKKTDPVVSSAASLNPITWLDKQTNAPPPLSQSDQAKLQFYQNRDAALIRQNPTQNPTAAPFQLQTNSVAPQLAPAMSLTGNPAGGTLPPIDQARNDAMNALKERTGANGAAVRARFKSLYGQDL